MKKGDFYRDFEVRDIFRSRDFKGEARLLCHKSSGLRIFHIHNKDEENFFSITFNTPSENSCGTAHILEHSVLCGSKSFPSKTLFADLASQTTNTFLNAMTYRDHTSFAAGSLIQKDFFTLFRAYLDATFFPLIKPETFSQEAHRFEIGGDGKLKINGVVYSEMRGEYSDFEGVVSEKLLTTFFHNSHYGFDSGGDPNEIPKLTHGELVDFHRRHYTPDNCIIFLYGNIETVNHIDFLHENILQSDLPRGKTFPLVGQGGEKPFSKTLFVEGPSSEERPTAGIAWKIDTGGKAATFHSINLLYKLLFETDASLLKTELIDGGFGSDFSVLSDVVTVNRFALTTFAMRGISREDFPGFSEFLLKKLEEISERDIPESAVEIVLNEWEFSLKELSAQPRPLSLFNKSINSLLYSESPIEFLQSKKIFNRIKREIRKDTRFFQKLIKKYFLHNDFRLNFFAEGSQSFDKEYPEREKAFCTACELSHETVSREEKKLKTFQEKTDFVSIPHLEQADLPKKTPFDYAKNEKMGNFDIFTYETDTNGINYLAAFFSLGNLSPELLPFMPFFCNAITATGFGGKSWHATLEEISAHTGDFVADCQCDGPKFGCPGSEEPIMTFWASCLQEKIGKTAELMAQCVETADFSDLPRLGMIFNDYCMEVKSTEFHNQLSLVAKRCNIGFSPEGDILEIFYGMSQIQFVKLNETISIEKLATILLEIKNRILSGGVKFLVVSEKKATDQALHTILRHFGHFKPYEDGIFQRLKPDLSSFILKNGIGNNEIFKNPAMTGFSGTTISPLNGYDSRFVYLSALSAYLNRGELWRKIRVKQGAYGVSTGVSPSTGLFWFYTYRDPNPENSFFLFKETLEEFLTKKISQEQILKIIISQVGNKIRRTPPGSRGISAYMHTYLKIPPENHLKLHKMLLNLTEKDLKLSSTLLLKGLENRRTCIFQ